MGNLWDARPTGVERRRRQILDDLGPQPDPCLAGMAMAIADQFAGYGIEHSRFVPGDDLSGFTGDDPDEEDTSDRNRSGEILRDGQWIMDDGGPDEARGRV